MALINFARREIEVKIVFYGPAFSGKTTNVEVLHRLMPAAQRGELHSLRTEQDRTLFFDYVPVRLGEIVGFTARFKLFTVPGQVFYKETRRVLLQGADAVVFVADSSPDRAAANSEALYDLEDNLKAHGLDLHSIPLVIQVNKRDAVGAQTIEAMTAELNPFGVPVVEAVAAEGRGVLETLRTVTEIAAQRIRENLSGHSTAVQLTAIERAGPEDERAVVREQLEHIRHVREREDAAVERMRKAGQLNAGDVDAVLSELVVRSEDVTPPEPIAPTDGPFDELPVPRGEGPAPGRPQWGNSAGFPGVFGAAPGASGLGAEVTPVRQPRPRALPEGEPLITWLGLQGARIRAVGEARAEKDGSARFELDIETSGAASRHVVLLRPDGRERFLASVPAPEKPRPAAPSAGRWVAFGGATLLAAVAGLGVGLILGWLVFHGS